MKSSKWVASKSKRFHVGDYVRYSVSWLGALRIYTGALCFVRGIVVSVQALGDRQVCKVYWYSPHSQGEIDCSVPHSVLGTNLEKVPSSKALMELKAALEKRSLI